MPNFDDDNRDQLKRQDPQSVKPGRKEEDETKPKDRYPREGQGRGSDESSGEPGSTGAGSSRPGSGSRSGSEEPDGER